HRQRLHAALRGGRRRVHRARLWRMHRCRSRHVEGEGRSHDQLAEQELPRPFRTRSALPRLDLHGRGLGSARPRDRLGTPQAAAAAGDSGVVSRVLSGGPAVPRPQYRVQLTTRRVRERMAITLEDVTVVLSELVSIPSINPHLSDHPDAGETAIADHIVGWCASRGIEAWTEEAAPGRPDAIARVGSGSPVLILCAHIDTVAIDGMTIEPFESRVEDGRLYGRGAYDMKAGAAAILCALEALAKEPAAGTVIGAFVCDEEWASVGAYDFVERHGGDAC